MPCLGGLAPGRREGRRCDAQPSRPIHARFASQPSRSQAAPPSLPAHFAACSAILVVPDEIDSLRNDETRPPPTIGRGSISLIASRGREIARLVPAALCLLSTLISRSGSPLSTRRNYVTRDFSQRRNKPARATEERDECDCHATIMCFGTCDVLIIPS